MTMNGRFSLAKAVLLVSTLGSVAAARTAALTGDTDLRVHNILRTDDRLIEIQILARVPASSRPQIRRALQENLDARLNCPGIFETAQGIAERLDVIVASLQGFGGHGKQDTTFFIRTGDDGKIEKS